MSLDCFIEEHSAGVRKPYVIQKRHRMVWDADTDWLQTKRMRILYEPIAITDGEEMCQEELCKIKGSHRDAGSSSRLQQEADDDSDDDATDGRKKDATGQAVSLHTSV